MTKEEQLIFWGWFIWILLGHCWRCGSKNVDRRASKSQLAIRY